MSDLTSASGAAGADGLEGVEPLADDDPREVGSYTLIGRLGAGGQATVYLGRSADGGRVAVKVPWLPPGSAGEVRRRFAGELAAARRVPATHTAAILDADVDGDRPYIVSEYVPGRSLELTVGRDGPLTGAALERLASYTAIALATIHGAGVVHRDFKPANVLIGPDGPRVVDFGIARALEAGTADTRSLIGTPAFMAPEQIVGAPLGPHTDVFAWAGTIVFAATGHPAFGRGGYPVLAHRITSAPPDLHALPAGPLRDLLGRCLIKDPSRRPSMLDAVRALAGERPADPAAPSRGLPTGAPPWGAPTQPAAPQGMPQPPGPRPGGTLLAPPGHGSTRTWLVVGASVTAVVAAAAVTAVVLLTRVTLPDPVARWSFDEGAGTTAADTFGGHTGRLQDGAGWAAGKYGEALRPGGGAMVTDGPVIRTDRDFTVAAWVRLGAGQQTHTVASQDGTVNGAFHLHYTLSAGSANQGGWKFSRPDSDRTSAPRAEAAARPTRSLGAWTHLAGVYERDQGRLVLYVDGDQAAQTTFRQPWNASGPFRLGAFKFNGTLWDRWPGEIDEVRVYDRALTPDQARELPSAGGS